MKETISRFTALAMIKASAVVAESSSWARSRMMMKRKVLTEKLVKRCVFLIVKRFSC